MTYTLAIDRSGGQGSWALYQNQKELISEPFTEDKPRSPTWFPSIIAKLSDFGLTPSEIDEYIVGTGPGSFSGIRAVIAALQGLALPTGIPVMGIPSVAATAYALSKKTGNHKIAVIGDARRGELWLGKYDFSIDSEFTEPKLFARDALPALDGFCITSPDYARLAGILAGIPDAVIVGGNAVCSASDIAAFFFAYPKSAVRDPLPIYLHPAVMK